MLIGEVYCFEYSTLDGTVHPACLIKLGNIYAFPIFNHWGEYVFDTANNQPTKCDWYDSLVNIIYVDSWCNYSGCSDKVTANSYCHVMDFIIGAIFYDVTNVYPIIELIVT